MKTRRILALVICTFFYFCYHGIMHHFCDKRCDRDDILSQNRTFVLNKSHAATRCLCVITRVYGPQVEYLPVLALGLRYAGLQNIRMFVVNTDNRTDIGQLAATIEIINKLVRHSNYIRLLDMGVLSAQNDYGYDMTDRALKYLYEGTSRPYTTCAYVMFTNADNFYARSFGKYILPYMKTK
ncbi:unnamed protein product, partial [Adineta ricciae]